MPAFAPSLPLLPFHHSSTQLTSSRHPPSPSRSRPPPPPLLCTSTPRASTPATPPPPTTLPVPSSLASAASIAASSALQYLTTPTTAASPSRAFITLDTTAGDETYTLLKSTLPALRLLLHHLSFPSPSSRVEVLLPDAGAAALIARDWAADADDPVVNAPRLPHVSFAGLDRWRRPDDADEEGAPGESLGAVVIVAPRASDVEGMEAAVESATDESGGKAPLKVVVVNPDLVDMGVTGLSLNARQLRERLIDSFETVFYLRTYGWGVLARAWPGCWGVWVDAPNAAVAASSGPVVLQPPAEDGAAAVGAVVDGWTCVGVFQDRPTNDQIEEAVEGRAGGGDGGGGGGAFLKKLSRFLKLYSQG